MIIPQNEPYTESTKEYNIKPRLVWCSLCNYVVVSSLPAPKCGVCHSNLITISLAKRNR